MTNLTNNDPPSHTHVRRFLRDAFSAKRIGWLEPGVVEIVRQVVDDIVKEGAANGCRVDLVNH